MRSLILGLVVLVVLGSTAWPTRAQEDYGTSAGTSSQTISGSVVSSNGDNLTITTDSGQQMAFTVQAGSVPSNLQSGSRVDVTYLSQSDGKLEATKVMLSSAQSSGTGTSATSSGETGTAVRPADQSGAMHNTEANGTESRRLPGTASSLPLVGIIGLIALGGAVALRLTSQRP